MTLSQSSGAKGASSTSSVSVCKSSCVIGALELEGPTRLAAPFSSPNRLRLFKVMFLRDKDWAQVVKTNHFPRHYLTLGGPYRSV